MRIALSSCVMSILSRCFQNQLTKVKYTSICSAHILPNVNALVRSLVIWDHAVLSATRQRWFSRLYTRRIAGILIYRPREDERLSWPEHREWTVGSELLRDDITGANCPVVTPLWAGMCERLTQGRYLAADRPRLEPATFRSLIRRSSHYSTRPHLRWYETRLSCKSIKFITNVYHNSVSNTGGMASGDE